MAFTNDEITRESCVFLSATTLRLTGATANHLRFRDAKRRDGSPVQTGDRFTVGVIQSPAGRAICGATLTLGADDTLTLNTAKVYKSTAGAGLPTFSSAGAPGEVYVTTSTAEFSVFDDEGNLLSPDLFRRALAPEKITADLLAEIGSVDLEAALPQGLASAGDGLAGLFGFDAAASDTEDLEDIFESDAGGVGRWKRRPIKPWPTIRGQNIGAGGALTVLAAAVAGRQWLVSARDATGVHRSAAIVTGHASDPVVDVIAEYGSLPFQLSGTNVQVRNASAGAITVSFIRPIIG